jgi:hypothetical protein
MWFEMGSPGLRRGVIESRCEGQGDVRVWEVCTGEGLGVVL